MSLSLSGWGGEIRIGRKQIATIKAWSKGSSKKDKSQPDRRANSRISFQVDQINEHWANYGPPTSIAVLLTGGKRLVYEVESGDFRAGALIVTLPPRVERI